MVKLKNKNDITELFAQMHCAARPLAHCEWVTFMFTPFFAPIFGVVKCVKIDCIGKKYRN